MGRRSAAAYASAKVAEVRDDPDGRLALLRQLYQGDPEQEQVHLPYRRAAVAFMSWQLRRQLLNPPGAACPGSPWWRAANERLLRDGYEARALADGYDPAGSSSSVAASVGSSSGPPREPGTAPTTSASSRRISTTSTSRRRRAALNRWVRTSSAT
jgi:hypothetical protein